MNVVEEAWRLPVMGRSPLMLLHNKLLNTAKALTKWSCETFGNARLQLHMVQEIILRLDIAQEERSLTQDELELRRDLKIRVLGLAAVERARRRQSSRITWLKEGDACTKFFHLKVNGRRRKNFTPSLKRKNGTLVWTHKEKEQELLEHFVSMMGKKVPRGCTFNWEELDLSTVEGMQLERAFTLEEIKQAVLQLPAEKAPGPDGFT